ncbi:MAG: ABC transporter permease [Anaerolineae bacterium]|nr:ABC transporter permease [Anaerolineae bacterium]
MDNLFKAEWLKTIKNYMFTSFLVWIFPVGMAGFFATMIALALISDKVEAGILATSSGLWTIDTQGVWSMITTFPANVFGRIPLLAFMAASFASEYEWRTWKNIVPRNRRFPLLLTKIIVLISIVMISLTMTSFISGIGYALGYKIGGAAYGPPITLSAILEFIPQYAKILLIGLISLMVLATMAALTGILTRSILGGMLAAFLISTTEPMALPLLSFFSGVFDRPRLVNLYKYTPTYNIENIRSWFDHAQPLEIASQALITEPSLAVSILICVIWIVGFLALSSWIFYRQDLTE